MGVIFWIDGFPVFFAWIDLFRACVSLADSEKVLWYMCLLVW